MVLFSTPSSSLNRRSAETSDFVFDSEASFPFPHPSSEVAATLSASLVESSSNQNRGCASFKGAPSLAIFSTDCAFPGIFSRTEPHPTATGCAGALSLITDTPLFTILMASSPFGDPEERVSLVDGLRFGARDRLPLAPVESGEVCSHRDLRRDKPVLEMGKAASFVTVSDLGASLK